ncbi:endonuclease domain-containing protein [Allosphingosinicella indica]|uniref:Very-short-patch-repair endonuclease n=1 Tax=Allosphingosinicella indica TaxID=941907 RepID=A0A1X7FYV5_9SPHN|nr:DUF559 domain-containing protein [Allosphingosinicella indica]SMF61310.1 Very-short-patch-repair endonuclease [Allosphingosinicella indica]
MAQSNPPRNGEGDRAKRGGGGVSPLRRRETYQARDLRREMSLPEVLLWQRLRDSATGHRFRRQHPIGPYIADFCCLAVKLVVEIDGEAHDWGDRPAHDDRRDMFLKQNGYRILHINASDVLRDIDSVICGVIAEAENPLHQAAAGPPPRAGEDLA